MGGLFPPQGILTAGALEDNYISLFKAKDPRAARVFPASYSLYASGKLTVDEIAAYANDVLDTGYIAHVFEDIFPASFCALIMNSANFSVSKAASVLNHVNTSSAKAASILDSVNISSSKASLILEDANLTDLKASSILSNANISADRTQTLLYGMPFSTKLVDILTCGASDLHVTTAATIKGVNRYGSLLLDSGVTATVDGQPGVIIAKTIENHGSISKTATGGAGGAAAVTGAGAGGAGGGGLIIFADSLYTDWIIEANGASGSIAGTVAASGNGGDGGTGSFLLVGADSPGTGGAGGGSAGGGLGRLNGGGGGNDYSYTAGGGGDSTRTALSDYPSLAELIKRAAIDWVIGNVYGKTPTSTTSFPSVCGSGGGGGCAWDAFAAGGGGGGGGGEIIILCVTLNNIGTIRANGGGGGDGGTEGLYDSSGGGGGGGVVYLLYKSLQNVGTLSAAGGAASSVGDYLGKAGTAGTAKAVAI
jgi:hypothetical protein